MKKRLRHISLIFALLLIGSVANEAWAAKVTYHILTLPIDNSIYHMVGAANGHRLEAVKIVVDNQTTVELPAHYKSPLATGFTYYNPSDITIGSTISLYTTNTATKGTLYQVNGETTVTTADDPTPVAEGTAILGSTAEYYVVYTYNSSNTIAKLDGSVNYNIGSKNKGFLAYNRGRNDRPAVVPIAKVDPNMLSSEDFVKIENPGGGITTYWSSGDNKNPQSVTSSKFHFIFQFDGQDPYNIIIRTAYDRDTTFIEKNEEGDKKFVYKWYKEGNLLSVGTANCFIVSDINKRYKTEYNSAIPNPTDPAYDDREGYLHGLSGTIWGTVALLNNVGSTGYVFMGTRTVDGSGNTPTPGTDNKYYYINFGGNNLNITKQTAADATKNNTMEGIYPVKKLTFKVPTPFYAVEATEAHIVSVPRWVSQYVVDNELIDTKYLPALLRRKYCSFTGKFYSDAACTQEITRFSQANYDITEGYQVYLGYEVSASIPFKAITPAASYNATTWAGATWYELTDEGSTQEYGRKLKYDGTNFKNNGADGEYAKTSEFAFIGDPYELRVVYRDATSDASPFYVGAAGTSPTTGTSLTASSSASAGYLWDIPTDDVTGSFLLQKYKGDGCWNWDTGQPSGSVAYQSNLAYSTGKDAQTITFTVSSLNGSKYIKVTTGGADAAQILSVSPTAGSVVAETGTSATVTVKLAANTSGVNKTMTVTVQEYSDDKGSSANGTASVITITQGTSSSSFAGNTVEYSTTNSTYVKVLELPTFSYTYNIVDKAGNIAAKATTSQTIFSPLSLYSIPSVIISPYLVDETITFYSTYGGTGRGSLSSEITALPAGNSGSSTNVYVKYTTTHLDNKPIKLSENQEFNVKLNGRYVYYDKTNDVLKTKDNPSASELKSSEYLWKLRNRDPYNMLIDNLGAREDLGVAGLSETPPIFNDGGVSTTESRQRGAWLKLNGDLLATSEGTGLTFDTDRTHAQRLIAKASNAAGVYEVMVATDDVDAGTTYYDIGCSGENTVKIYSNSTYVHGDDVLKFILNQNVDYTYHLIDKAKHELLTATSKTPDLALPAEYQSPLVATYSFYSLDQMTVDSSKEPDEYTPTDPAIKLSTIADLDAAYTKTSGNYSSEWSADVTHQKTATDEADVDTQAKQLESTGHFYFRIGETSTYYDVNVTRAYRGKDIYVTYTVNDLIGFNNSGKVNDHPYLLKFLDPYAAGYYLEDGNDKLTTSLIQAVYPYCNGDGNLNIYGTAMRDEQMNGGSSTRPRWVWFFESANSDPYHVRIHSRSTISFNSVNYPTYLETSAVHFNQSAAKVQTVVTGGALPGVASTDPTEYMILGTAGAYKLLTTQPVAADLDGDGDTTDAGENERRFVTSFEQYWKTYNMAKLHVLGVSASTDEYSTDESTWKVPTTGDYRTTLAARGWHSYDAYANATRWNGYNDKSSGHEKKVVEKLEHWFQTFDMGNGTFDVEDADIPPVLVLLDRHGWEIMRRPLPVANYPLGDDELAALRVYDSPLVDKYYFYSNATKASGCHKYTLRLQDGKERDQIKVNGERYSSTSLADLPPANASGVKSSGVLNDQFVIYTVKEEYEQNYAYALTYTGDKDAGYNITTETGTSQPYLVLQNGRFYKIENNNEDKSYFSKPIIEHTNPSGGNIDDLIVSPRNYNSINIIDVSGNFIGNNFWYVKPNMNIDKEMGIKWGASNSGAEPLTENATKVTYKDKSGFDPYNIQLQLKNKTDGTTDGRYLTTHMTSAHLDNGIMVGDYDAVKDAKTTFVTLEAEFNSYDSSVDKGSEGYDHTNLQISNQTFMAVSDANGNIQLMPRFDHTLRVHLDNVSPWQTQLSEPIDHAKASLEDNNSMGPQTTFFVRPQRFIYHIIDNNGREALRYTRGGDNYPEITDHFKSPLATDFTYYKGLAVSEIPVASTEDAWAAATGEFKRTVTRESLLADLVKLLPTAGTYQYRIGTRGIFTYKSVVVSKGLSEQEITGSFAAADLDEVDSHVYVRYNYDEEADLDADRILQGQWFTVKLADKDLQSSGTIVITEGETQGTGVNLYADDNTPTKPGTVDAAAKQWQWKFLAAPTDPSSDYYVSPDPYAIQLFNRQSNYTTNPTAEPSPMAVGIKVPNETTGADRFALLSHPSGGYALVVAKTYTDNNYPFLNGVDMTEPDAGTPVAATTVTEAGFTYKTGAISDGAQLLVDDDVEFHYTYNVINNANKLAITAEQDTEEAASHEYAPYLPESAQTPLLNMDDYVYYGFANKSDDTYAVIAPTKLYTLAGLYDDVVYVRYGDYNMDKTSFKVPNKRDIVDSHVARHSESNDASMNINGGLPYNIIWYNDNMMKSTDGSSISDGGSQNLSGVTDYIWYFTGGDPYALKIKHKNGNYVDGTTTLVAEGSAQEFMMLKKSGYDYGILQVTGTTGANAGKKLTGYGGALTADASTDPAKFIIFGLSVHNLYYHLIIAKTCPDTNHPNTGEYVDIPYRNGDENKYTVEDTWLDKDTTRIFGTTQRNLDDIVSGIAGDKFQLGSTISWGGINHIYSHNAGTVSIGDKLQVPNVFYRPNCTFEFYIEGIYSQDGTTAETNLNNRFKGLKLKNLMSASELIDKTVVVNIVYKFNETLATNAGLGFVTSVGQNLWYTFETPDGATPYLAQYTNAWGLQAKAGRDTRYTNDYLWTPLGDPYGFKMYNRYMIKNSGGVDNVMTMNNIGEGKNLYLAVPGTTLRPTGEEGAGTVIPEDYGIFELIAGDMEGYFRVHPMANTSDQPQYYVRRGDSNYAVLSTTPSDWTFGLDMTLLEPYYERAGYVGGLTAVGKTAYETAVATDKITNIQKVVYNDANIIPYTPGYYRLHSQPGVSGISPVRYASGYLHDTEKTAVSGGIPMHFYSKSDVSTTFAGEGGLGSGFTITPATQGEIPLDPAEVDLSTIFYFSESGTDTYDNPTSKMQTQGLYVAANANGDGDNGTKTSKLQRAVMSDNSANAITFSLMDIGGAILLIHDGYAPPTRRYLNFDQSNSADIYDLKYYHESPTDDAKWCMQPVQKTATAGNGEMPLIVKTNNGGDDYYYTTFYAPFDVLLPSDADGKTYNAYVCQTWQNAGLNTAKVEAHSPYDEGKFVPAGTPVIIRVKDESGSVTLTLPNSSPSSPLSCAFAGSYLEKLLAVDASHDVYTLGLPMTSNVEKAGDYNTSGNITAPLPEFANTGVGFYINATRNKESNPLEAMWTRNNRYVLHNKIYYRATGGGARDLTRGVLFVPVVFDDDKGEDPDIHENEDSRVGDGCAYDLLGRKVATEQQVKDGTWRQHVAPGIYIVHGKKVKR